jgi:hypothetical protein
MALLVYLHVAFNQKPITCLSHLQTIWPKQGVLRVELFLETPSQSYNLQQSYAKEYQNNHIANRDDNAENSSSKVKKTFFTYWILLFLSLKNFPIANIIIEPPKNDVLEGINSLLLPTINATNNSFLSDEKQLEETNLSNETVNDSLPLITINESDDDDNDNDDSLLNSIQDYLFNFDWVNQLLVEEQHILEYSLEYGFLRLSPETRRRLNIEVLLITLGKTNKKL